MRVAILGASERPDRFSYKAFRLLREHGHEVLPVSPRISKIEDVSVVAKLSDVSGGAVDTLTMYVGPALSSGMTEEILSLHPRRVIFNPGSENPALAARLESAGIEVVEDCTLVMLRTSRF